jgi:hypothetical protein
LSVIAPRSSSGAPLSFNLFCHPAPPRQQQCPIEGINDTGQRSTTKLAIERVALKSMTVEARCSGPSKQKSRIAFWTFNFAKPRSFFLCFGQHTNKPKSVTSRLIPYQNMRRGKRILPRESAINLTAQPSHQKSPVGPDHAERVCSVDQDEPNSHFLV